MESGVLLHPPDSALLHPGYKDDVHESSLRGTKQSIVVMFTTLDCRAALAMTVIVIRRNRLV